ncbi:MAG TPA: glycoside hydrolase family 3 C-terminal domain-containing protein [Micromonosporaceae bacterium]
MEIPDLAGLTEAEKIALTAGEDYSLTRGVPRLGVPAILLCDGPHGLRKQADTSRFSTRSVPATCFPTASALAATWDVDLVERVAVALGEEARTEGVGVLLGPGCTIKRTPLCGRNFEYYSEDPYLSSRLAAAWIRGVQSTGVGASLKHFAANNIEARRYSVDSLVDERALREIYLASFEYAVRSAQPATVMAAYNRLNGRFCTDNPNLLGTILRDEWGFAGAVVSDWGATNGRAASLASGLDLTMPGMRGADDAAVVAARRGGTLPPDALDRAASAMLRLVARTAPARAGGFTYSIDEHHALARRAAAAGMVLLRNEGGVLPLPKTGSVAVLGAFAKVPRYQGAGSSGITAHRVDNARECLVAALGTDRVTYADGYHRDAAGSDVDDEPLAQACAVASGADVAVVFVGLPESSEVEGLDRVDIDLPAAHDALVEAVTARHPRVVVVVVAGAPVAMPWRDKVSAVVHAYLGGQAGGCAIADVLSGQMEPGGRLAETFPVRLGDNPVHAMPFGPRQTEYRESVYVGYRWYDTAGIDVAWPFGHGLSYTTFAWTGARAELVGDAEVEVRVTVANTGTREGSEVVQVYVHDVAATVFRPAQELHGFAKLHLEPGESRVATIRLDHRAFAFWDVSRHEWTVEQGEFQIRLGASSRDIRAVLPVTIAAPPVAGLVPGPPSYHDVCPTSRFDRDDFARVYGMTLPENVPDRRGGYTQNTPIADMDHAAARALLRVLRWGARRALHVGEGSPELLLVERTIGEMTPRMLSMFLGATGDRLARVLVRVANRRWLRWLPTGAG